MATFQESVDLYNATEERFNRMYRDPYEDIIRISEKYAAAYFVPQIEAINQITENYYNTCSNAYGGNSSIAKYEKIVHNLSKQEQIIRNISDVTNSNIFAATNSSLVRNAVENNNFANKMNSIYHNKYENMHSSAVQRFNNTEMSANTYRRTEYNTKSGDTYGGSSLNNDNSSYTNGVTNYSEYVSGGSDSQKINYNNITLNIEMNNTIEKSADADMVIRELEQRITGAFASNSGGIHI